MEEDAELLTRFRRGDHDAATALYVKYSARLREIAKTNTSGLLNRRFDADDVVQSVFRTFFRRVTEGYFNVPAGDELWNLFLVIALNKIRRLGKFHRRQRRDVSVTEAIDGRTFATADPTPLTVLELSIDEMLETLPPLKRKVIEMRIMGHPIDDITKETERCSRTVERILRQFREMLSRQLRET